MRTSLFVLVVLTGVALVALVVEQIFVEQSLGPAAMVAVALLGMLFVALLVTLLLSRTRHRQLIGNIWLAIFSIVVTYLVLDFAAGWILIKPLSPPLVPDQVRHHKLVPDSFAEFQQRDFSYVQRVNKHGLRGEEISTQKTPGTYRIVMLGDSFTMGKGVEDNQTFSTLVGQLLNQDSAGCGRTFEVLNGGVDSYAPILELLYLKHDLQALDPDLVVLNLDLSDLVQEHAYRTQAVRSAEGEVIAVPQRVERESLVERIRVWTERHLFFTRVLLLYANRAMGYREVTVRDVVTRANAETVAYTLEGDRDRTAEWNALFDSISRMNAYSQQRGIDFLLTVYPWAHEISDTEWVPGRFAFMPEDARATNTRMSIVRKLAEASRIPFVDVTPAFKAYKGRDPLYFSYDMHWTTAGHQVMANALAAHLRQEYGTQWCK